MKKILAVFGTRPEAVKMCPLLLELKRREQFETYFCSTGQHREMIAPVLDIFGVFPDFDLEIMQKGQTLFDITQKTLDGLRGVMEKVRPDVVLVHGDTTTAFAAALCAFYAGVPVGHVEAGLRTYDSLSPYPEEFNRAAIDKASALCFAPTERSADNLRREGKRESEIFVVGNTAIDALRHTVKSGDIGEIEGAASGKRIITVTAHRRENIGENMNNMFGAINDISEAFSDVLIVYPVHKNPAVRVYANEFFGKNDRVILCEPLDVSSFHKLLSRSYMTLTDSGGIQEEAPSLGCPVVVMRNTTERPEAIEAGTAILSGTGRREIFDAASKLLCNASLRDKMINTKNPYGDGHASERIADILEKS